MPDRNSMNITQLKRHETIIFQLVIMGFLNISDGLFTYVGLDLGYISEANPIMKYFWLISPSVFILVKIFIPTFFIFVIYFSEKMMFWTSIELALKLVNLLYFYILITHLFIFFM